MTRWGRQASRKPNTKTTKRFGGFGFRTEDCVFLLYCDFCGQKGTKFETFFVCWRSSYFSNNARKDKKKHFFLVFTFGKFFVEENFKRLHGKKKNWALVAFAVSQVRVSSKNKKTQICFCFLRIYTPEI